MIHVHHVEGAFSPAESNAIVELASTRTSRDAGLVGQTRDHNLRRADLVWLDDVPGTDWVMDRIIDVVRSANRDAFGFELTEFAESPQVARYGAEREGHFDWHADIGDAPLARKRKLTFVAQLSDPQDYDGGVLELMPSAHVMQAPRAQGTATLFASYLLHRVTPVTQGARHSLTIWAHGPAFR
ncbi:2OG-Fe(II) oxygenase [Lutimaribacter saemankumensis]|uniref:PKHD-type hydroxylase n=1 Tax=Lutimaribacter saemankumensis TaxID=490829 RepID=A0A1G8L1L8_9RHOB|nr:2OG-Fe(II) oxygenase [Lutimaribacter saemankumensis]SDI49040.1 PKHD-type hydroxylase [Lutimaribacter saemankumensis]